MITTAKITAAPISGLYTEKIYDAPISTKNWTWIKFETNEYETFYGQFKGAPLQIALSKQNPYFYVLTDSLLYEVSRENPSDYTAYDQDDFWGTITNLTLTPSGQLLLSTYYELLQANMPLFKIEGDLLDTLIKIIPPVQIDVIEFKNWHNDQLHIQANYLGTSYPVNLYFDTNTNKIYEKNVELLESKPLKFGKY
ncbi:hypothetical protein [Kurthia senegalensis]|uniref:hypothetical protein n=1 Tax=Kurthia senegalensis TaxID=1033740 RepID=UPI00028988BE|nr:hypothetical protein [Kurthia senegalensis]